MHRLSLTLLALSALVVAGCGSSSNPSSNSSAAPSAASQTPVAVSDSPRIIQAKMANFAFQPAVIHARVGEEIRWVNADSAAHNVTGTSGPRFAASPTFGSGGSFVLKLTQAGTYQYICTIHAFMKATIVVSR